MDHVRRTAAALALALILLGAGSAVAGDWRYILPPPGDPFEHPPLRALALSRERPDDVKETVRYRGSRQRYAQLRYGSPGSVRVTVVLDEAGVLFENANNPGAAQVQAILDSLPASGL